jgi:uncharacterized protein YjbI with pentapeptide repeats
MATLTEAYLGLATLNKANLPGAALTKAYLRLATLAEANLSRATLTKADLLGAILTKADLTAARLSEAVLRGATLTEANLVGAELTEASLVGATLVDANIAFANLNRVITGCAVGFFRISITEARVGMTERCTDFRGSSMWRTSLDSAELGEAQFDPGMLHGACGTDVRLPDAFETELPACEDVDALFGPGDHRPADRRDDTAPRNTIHQD